MFKCFDREIRIAPLIYIPTDGKYFDWNLQFVWEGLDSYPHGIVTKGHVPNEYFVKLVSIA